MSETYTAGQTWGALRKSWRGYKIAKNKNQPDLMKTYQEQIHTLQKRLGVAPSVFGPMDSQPIIITKQLRHSRNATVKFAACFYCRQEDKDFRQFPIQELKTYGKIYLCEKHNEKVKAAQAEERKIEEEVQG